MDFLLSPSSLNIFLMTSLIINKYIKLKLVVRVFVTISFRGQVKTPNIRRGFKINRLPITQPLLLPEHQ